MQALRNFWARSLLNKLVLVVVVGVLCCCTLPLIGRGGRSTAAVPPAVPTAALAAASVDPTLAPTEEPTQALPPTSTSAPNLIATAVPVAISAPDPTTTAVLTEITADAGPYTSIGLGLGRAAFEAARGQPTGETAGFYDYGPNLSVAYFDGAVWHLEQMFGEPGIPVSDARALARLWLPQDAEFVETYTTRFGQLVDLYYSPSLITRFPSDEWINGKPGDHIVIYRRDEGSDLVFGIVVGTGNNP